LKGQAGIFFFIFYVFFWEWIFFVPCTQPIGRPRLLFPKPIAYRPGFLSTPVGQSWPICIPELLC
jgi:hypothetical protein